VQRVAESDVLDDENDDTDGAESAQSGADPGARASAGQDDDAQSPNTDADNPDDSQVGEEE